MNGCCHISVFMAGARTIGFARSQARHTQVRQLSQSPDGQLGERIGVERRDEEESAHWRSSMCSTASSRSQRPGVTARPFIFIQNDPIAIRGRPGNRTRRVFDHRRGVEEVGRGVGGDDLDRVPAAASASKRPARVPPPRCRWPRATCSPCRIRSRLGNGSAVEVLLQRVWPTAGERKGPFGHEKPLRKFKGAKGARKHAPSGLAPLLVKSWSTGYQP